MRILASIVAAALCTAPAAAADFLFTLSGSGFSGSGTITVDESVSGENRWSCPACAAGPGFLVTNIMGTINGESLGLIAQGAMSGNSNYLYLAGPYLDLDGLGFKIGGLNYDLFEGSNRSRFSYFLIGGADGLWDNPVEFEITPVGDQHQAQPGSIPEPVTWAMMIAGFGAVGVSLRRRQSAFA